ncbi:hypothetical protein [Clostridium kluyveri]|uniref:hypothetical protein n=1 Tax=Clostridium kluyveri TaxID=1534 RepID=UPI000B2FDE1B|nr:hypothetical protein [Clostridium kluyveri]UZQ49618.1 hypothetical protein OP486_16950 [Clostridium kluyveri]
MDDDNFMLDEELLSKIYDVAFHEMGESFREPGVYMSLLSTLGKEKADWFLDMWNIT